MEFLDDPLDRKPKPHGAPVHIRDLNLIYRYPRALPSTLLASLFVAAFFDYRSGNMIDPLRQKRIFRFVGGVWTPLVLFLCVVPLCEGALWEGVRKQVWFWQTSYLALPNSRLGSRSRT